MRIDNNYRLEFDNFNVTLRYESDPVDKEVDGELKRVTSKNEWYYATTKQALKAYLDRSMRDSSDVESILSSISYVEMKIENLEENECTPSNCRHGY